MKHAVASGEARVADGEACDAKLEEHVKEGHLSFVEILITLVNHLHLGLISDDYSVQPITKQEY